jgi:hypothetical protein
MATSGVDWRVIVRVKEFLVGRKQRVRLVRQLSKKVQVTSAVPQGSVSGPLLLLVYLNDIWRNIDTSVRLFTDDCKIYRKITNKKDIENLQKFLNNLGGMGVVVGNGFKIYPGKIRQYDL